MSQAEDTARGTAPTAITATANGAAPANGSAPVVGLQPPRLDELSPQTLYAKCMALARNLWWSWHPEVTNLFSDLDPVRWRQLDHNPSALLAEFTPERLDARAAELVLYSRINQAYRRMKEYLAAENTWSTVHAGVLGSKPVVYFSAEFGIHESVPIYSGGLGVLAGDHVKSASGLGIPLIAVGLFYNQGYFRQQLDIDITPDAYRSELAAARTFLSVEDAARLRAAGLGATVSPGDLVLFGADGPVGTTLRWPDECVRHKVLDCVGDLALAGRPLHAHVRAFRSGHALNAGLVRRLLAHGAGLRLGRTA